MDVGIRELKLRLSAYVAQVRRGEAIVVTDRGRPVARLEPYHEGEVPERFREQSQAGLLLDKGRPVPLPPPIRMKPGAKTGVDYVLDQRR